VGDLPAEIGCEAGEGDRRGQPGAALAQDVSWTEREQPKYEDAKQCDDRVLGLESDAGHEPEQRPHRQASISAVTAGRGRLTWDSRSL
jgi:hypothetical protein